IDGVESVSASYDVAKAVVSLKKAVSIAGSAIVVILAAVSLMIIANTVRLTVFSRRKEISIMKYVGATDAFIRLPFISEGVLLGLISASLSMLILWGGYEALARFLMGSDVSWMKLIYSNLVPFKSVALKMGIYFIGGGVSIGAFGSYVFLGKYLKV
ncbi:MAG: FtsX-like permease family protein, partial [Oscillospiraceae bacterium]